MNADAVYAVGELQRLLRENAAYDHSLNEALAFDPESDFPQPKAEAKIRELMGDAADRADIAPDMAYAIRKTGLLVTDRNKHLLDDDQKTAWSGAIAEYEKLTKWTT